MRLSEPRLVRRPRRWRGLFITFEGIEGSGKTSQIKALAAWLRRRGLSVVVTREPGGTKAGEFIRRLFLGPRGRGLDPWAELFLIEAARAQHLAEVVRPALNAGKIVLCDRFTDSTIAYQGHGRGLPLDVIERLHRLPALRPAPDLTFLFDLPVREGLARAAGRNPALARRTVTRRVVPHARSPLHPGASAALNESGARPKSSSADGRSAGGRGRHSETRLDEEPAIFHGKVRRGYRAIAKAEPRRVVLVPGKQDPRVIQDCLRTVV